MTKFKNNIEVDGVVKASDGVNSDELVSKGQLDAKVDDTAYAPTWDGVTTIAPSKNAVYDALTPLETATTIIDLSSVTGNYAYASAASTSPSFTITGVVTGGKADVLIDTIGAIDFPTVTGSTLINSSLFEVGAIYNMYIENNGNVTYHYFVKRDIGIISDVQTPQSATGDGTTTVDWNDGNFFNFQFGAFNETFTFTDPPTAGTFMLKLVQDSVGSRTVTFPGTVKWIDGTAPTLTTTATTGTDIITFYFDGINYFAVETLNFS